MLTGETRLDNLMRELSEIVQKAADWNNPLSRGGSVGHATGKPGSRSPGRQQCPNVVPRVAKILKAAIKDLEHEVAASSPRDAGAVKSHVVMADDAEIIEGLEALYAVGGTD